MKANHTLALAVSALLAFSFAAGDADAATPLAPGGAFRLSGVTDVAAQIAIGTVVDRGYPDYDFPARIAAPVACGANSFQASSGEAPAAGIPTSPQSTSTGQSITAPAARLRKNNPRLPAERAAFLADHWAEPDGRGRLRVAGDPAHRIVNPVLYRVDEAMACWRAVTAHPARGAPSIWRPDGRLDSGMGL